MSLDSKESLKKKSVAALFWTVAELLIKQVFQFGVAVYLARLLSPQEFGTIALLFVFVGLANVFIEGGFASALVQKQDVTNTDENTVFWTNFIMAMVMTALLYFFASSIALYFDKPILKPLMNIVAVSVFISSLGSIQHTLLTKRLNFKIPMQSAVIAALVSGLAACLMAYEGYGVWALAWQGLIYSFVSVALLWILGPWRPSFIFSFQSLRTLFAFGGYIMLTSLIDQAYQKFYAVLIGKGHGAYDLGIYDRANNTQQIPAGILSMVIYRVAFPLFSAAASDKARLRRGMVLAIRFIMLINVPIMFGLMITADKVVPLLFGEQWLPSIPILQVLCFAGVLWPLHVINLNVLKSLGYSHLFFRIEIIKKIVGTIFIIIGFNYGLIGLAWSQVASGITSFWINSYYSKQFVDYGFLKQLRDIFPVIIISMVMVLAIIFFSSEYQFGVNYKDLFLEVLIGIIVYVSLYLAAYYEDCKLLLKLIKKKEINVN